MGRIREVLRREYIGAIAIGFLVAQSVVHLISGLIQPLSFYLAPRTTVFGRERVFSWEELILPNVVSAILHGAAAYVLYQWVYADTQGEPVIQEEDVDSGEAS